MDYPIVKIRFKLYEEDFTENQEVIDQKFTIDKDHYIINVTLKNVSRSKGDNLFEGFEQEFFVDIEVLDTHAHIKSATVNVDAKALKQDKPTNVSKAMVEQPDTPKKEKFDPVKEKAEEAVIHITSEIATEIKVDKKGNVTFYPDLGGYNGQEEYIEDGKIYCKKIKVGKKTKSAFPTFKAYIYRGNTKGEAVKKLKLDLKNKTRNYAESTVLEVARHALSNNKNYLEKGPIPPNSVEKLYRIKYKKATNDGGKTSCRYRFIDDNKSNMPAIKDYTKEHENGAMSLGSRSSISIDPWNSKGLIGCVGIRGSNGENHPSTKDTYSKQDKENYKYIYHSINNYLEGVIPELTGVYGRRGFSTTSGTVTVSASTYDHEVKVFVLVDNLPEIDDCNCKKLKFDGRTKFYNSFGTKTIKYIDKESKANKFKGLYMVAQRRQENGFSLETIGNNPMNIKGKGDLGQIAMDTHETINGKYVPLKGEKFANFSSEDAGFKGYLDLLKSNYNDAYNSFFDDSKTIDDFTSGLEDTGKNGAYATGKAQNGRTGTEDYKHRVKSIFDGVKKDYIKIYECKLCKEKDPEKKKELKKDLDLLKKLK